MIHLLIKSFIKDYESTDKPSVRAGYALLSGWVGIAVNILLFLLKLFCGFVTGAVSIVADAFNNLSDVASSVITMIGMRLAGQPADKEHPFGHGRIEYLTGLCVSVMVLSVGLLLLFNSVKKVFMPEELNFSLISIFILGFSILGKAFLSVFNNKLGNLIHSTALLAVSADSRSDMLTTFAAAASLICYKFMGYNIDGLMGVIVSIYVLKTGFEIARETLLPIIGSSTDSSEAEEFTRFIEAHEGVLGSHDLIMHNYGPGKIYASVHVEISDDMSLNDSHVLLDGIEKEAYSKFDIILVTHADPVDLHDPRLAKIKSLVANIIKEYHCEGLSFHDLRVVNAAGGGLNVVFDLVIPWNYEKNDVEFLVDRLKRAIKERDPKLSAVITVEHCF